MHPHSQTLWQQHRCGGRKTPLGGSQDELSPPDARVRRRTPDSLLSIAADTRISPALAHSLAFLALTPHPARSHLHTAATLLAASSTTTSTSQQRTCCETRPATASSSLCRAPPFVWGSGFKGEWASMQGRMGGAAADRDNVQRSESRRDLGRRCYAGRWGGYVWRQRGGEDRLTRRRRERWGGGDGAVTRFACCWFCECVCDGGGRRFFF